MTNSERAYKKIMEDMIDTAKRFVVVQGIGDVVDRGGWMGFRPSQKDWYWTIIGFQDVESEMFNIDLSEEAEQEGEYEFQAIFQAFRDETPLEHISMRFTQTFAEREREQKLLDLLDFPDLWCPGTQGAEEIIEMVVTNEKWGYENFYEFAGEQQSIDSQRSLIIEIAKEFAKMHVKAALESAAENAEAVPYSEGAVGQCGVDEESILNSYNYDNIK